MKVFRRFLWCVSWSALALVSAGCSGAPSERLYSVPDDLCGMDVSSDLYDPLFPSGSDVSVVTSFADLADLGLLAGHECLIEVDGEEVIRSGDSAFDDFDTVIAGQKLDVKESEFVSIDGEFEVRIWPGVAVAKAPCTVSLTPGQNSMETYTIFLKSAYPKDDEESVEVLSQLIQPYMAAAIEGVPCAERDG